MDNKPLSNYNQPIEFNSDAYAVAREGLQILAEYYAMNGCILSQEISQRIAPIIEKRYGRSKVSLELFDTGSNTPIRL